MRLKKLEDHDMRILYTSPEINRGDWPFRYLVVIEYCEAYDREWARSGKYHVSIRVASPDAAGDKGCQEAMQSMGQSPEEWAELPHEWKCVMLSDYGLAAVLWQGPLRGASSRIPGRYPYLAGRC